MTRNQMSRLSFAVRQLPRFATKKHDNLATQRNPSLYSIGVIARFYLSCCLLADRIGLWSAECGQVNLHQHVFAAQSPCAKTFKSTVGSGDSALGISPILQLRQWFPTFFDAFLPLLILELFIPPLSNVHSSPVRIHRQVQLEQRSLWTTIT